MSPLKKGFKSGYCFIAGILVGIIMGTAALIVIVSYRIDSYYERIVYLEQVIQDKNVILEKFQKNVNTQSLVIKNIEVVLLFNGNEIDKITLEKSVKEKYSTLLGKEVKKIDPDLIIEVVDKRILRIGDKEYKLRVNKLILTEVLKIWISVDPVNE